MFGTIGEISFVFISDDESTENNYSAALGGNIPYLNGKSEKGIEKMAFLTKVGLDHIAERIESEMKELFPLSTFDFLVSQNKATLVSIDGESYIRDSAIATLKKEEIVSFIDKRGVDVLIISASLLSFKPLSDEIKKAIEERKEKLKAIFVDTTDSISILRLEELKDNIQALEKISKLFVVGEALNVDVSKRVSMQSFDSLILS